MNKIIFLILFLILFSSCSSKIDINTKETIQPTIYELIEIKESEIEPAILTDNIDIMQDISYDFYNYAFDYGFNFDTKNLDSLNKMIKEFSKYKIILAGETKGFKKNYELQLFLIKLLNTKLGYKHIISDLTPSETGILNYYLKDGNINHLNFVMQNLKNQERLSKEFYDFYKNLYDYNKNLEDYNKLNLIGLNINNSKETTFYFFKILLQNKDVPKELEYFKYLSKLKNFDNILLNRDAFIDAKNHIAENLDFYYDFFGEHTNDFERTINATIQSSTYKSYIDNNEFEMAKIFLENAFLQNFELATTFFGGVKYFGQFDSSHTLIHSENNINTIIADKTFAMLLLEKYYETPFLLNTIYYVINDIGWGNWNEFFLTSDFYAVDIREKIELKNFVGHDKVFFIKDKNNEQIVK